MNKTPTDVLNRLKGCVEKAMVESCNEIVDGIEKQARTRATLDGSESLYPVEYYKYQNIDNFETYLTKFTKEKAMLSDNVAKARVFNDYKVYVKRLQMLVPFGHLLEWGTGLWGFSTEDGTWSLGDYCPVPWDKATAEQLHYYGMYGMPAHAHWTQPYNKYKSGEAKTVFLKNLRNKT